METARMRHHNFTIPFKNVKLVNDWYLNIISLGVSI